MRRDDGAATVLVIAIAFVVVAATAAALVVATAVTARHRAAAAADLAALAVMSAAMRGDPAACDVGRRVAVANGARLVSCAATSTRADVVTEVPVRLWRLGATVAVGRARAGPQRAHSAYS